MLRGVKAATGGWAGLVASHATTRAPDDPLLVVPPAEEASCRALLAQAAQTPRVGRTTLAEAMTWAKSHMIGRFAGVTVSRRLLRVLLEGLEADGVEEVDVHVGYIADVRVIAVVCAMGSLVLSENRQPYDRDHDFEVSP